MNRLEFLKISGAGALGAAALGITGCSESSKTGGDKAASYDGNVIQREPGIGLLGFGAMRWPMTTNDKGESVIDQEKVNEMVDLALEHGVNYFDSAPVYLRGMSEAATGLALSRHPRESYYIATKLSNPRGPYDLEGCKQMYFRSLENFQTDYIDYYLLHNINSYDQFVKRFVDGGVIDYLLEERKAGRIRHLGFSVHCPKEEFAKIVALHDRYHWDFVQIQMNYADWYVEEREASKFMYEELDKREIPVVIMEPLLGGRLASIPAMLSDVLKEERPQDSNAAWAFRFLGSFPRIQVILSGMTYKEHLEDNLGTFCNFEPLSEKEFGLLERVAKGLREYPIVDCTNCQYCMPCPYGIDIPGIFAFYNKNVVEGTYATSTEQKNYRRLKTRYLANYNKAFESVRQADHCIGCEQCLPKCPQNIKIPEKLHSIDSYIEDLKQGKL